MQDAAQMFKVIQRLYIRSLIQVQENFNFQGERLGFRLVDTSSSFEYIISDLEIRNVLNYYVVFNSLHV